MFYEELPCVRLPRRTYSKLMLPVHILASWPWCDWPTDVPWVVVIDMAAQRLVREFLNWRDQLRLPTVASVPVGAPKWITLDLIRVTLDVWQPYYWERLTSDDALEILLGVGNLIDVLEQPA